MQHGFVRRATLEDASYIIPRLRRADAQECDATVGMPPAVVIPHLIKVSPRVWTFGLDDGEPVGLFGVDPASEFLPQLGIAWMLSSTTIESHPYSFLARSREIVDFLHTDFPILTNMVDARNTLHIKWLRWLGFAMLRKVGKWGARSVPFLEFARLQQCASLQG